MDHFETSSPDMAAIEGLWAYEVAELTALRKGATAAFVAMAPARSRRLLAQRRQSTARSTMPWRLRRSRAGSLAWLGSNDAPYMSPSTLSRKLSPGDGDTQRFNVDDLEHYMQVTGDTGAIEYLAAKYLCSDKSRQIRALARVEALSAELAGLVAGLKGVSL
jgi:hypothetical protein